MDTELVKGVGATAGILAVVIGMLVQVFGPMLQKNVLSSMSKQNAYRLLHTIVVGCLLIAAVGIAAWAIAPPVAPKQEDANSDVKGAQTTHGNCSPNVAEVKGNVTVNGDCN